MVLYSVITTYHLLEAIVHKTKYNANEKSVLLISNWLENKYPWFEKLKDTFDKIIVFKPSYNFSTDIKGELDTYYDMLFSKNNIRIDDFEQIHVFGAEHSFGAYIFANQIKNLYWEEGAGALSKKDSMLEIFEKVHGAEKAKFQYELHLGDGDCSFVETRFYNKYYQLKEVEGSNLCHFDLQEELNDMDKTKRDNIIKHFYGKDKICANENSVLLLTEHFANLAVMSWSEQILLYKYLVDYFLEGYELLIKPHPDDTMYYEYEFNGCTVIRKRFPAELLPFIFENNPSAVATSSSTSIYGLRSLYEKTLEFNFKFSHCKQFYSLNRYFVALSILKGYIDKGYKLNILGVNPAIIRNFYEFNKLGAIEFTDLGSDVKALKLCNSDKAIFIIDELDNAHESANVLCQYISELSNDAIVIFINSDGNYCFYDYEYSELWKEIKPVGIKIKNNENLNALVTFAGPSLNENRTEMIYVYQKGMCMDIYSMKKELPNVGVTVETADYDWKEEKIKLLEGMLEATEKRLLYYMKKTQDAENDLEGAK